MSRVTPFVEGGILFPKKKPKNTPYTAAKKTSQNLRGKKGKA
jgi:hypothetical protein